MMALKGSFCGPGFNLVPVKPTEAVYDDDHPSYTGSVYILDDQMAAGHFHMTIAAYFSELVAAAQRGERDFPVAHQHVPLLRQGEASGEPIFRPLLENISDYAASEWKLAIRTLNQTVLDRGHCFSHVARRQCMIQIAEKFTGHCFGWFANQQSVSAWRAFLMHQRLVPSGFGELRTNEQIAGDFRILVVDRKPGYQSRSSNALRKRFFADRETVLQTVQSACSSRLNAERCRVELQVAPEAAMSFGWNCERFAVPDMIISVHGGALGNLMCASPDASVVEIGLNWPSMYTPLAAQLGLRTCFVNATGGAVTPLVPDFARLHGCVASLSGSSATRPTYDRVADGLATGQISARGIMEWED